MVPLHVRIACMTVTTNIVFIVVVNMWDSTWLSLEYTQLTFFKSDITMHAT